MITKAAIVLSALLAFGAIAQAEPALEQIGEFNIREANQGVGVDARHFYAVDNETIAKYDKKTGKLVKMWQGEKGGPIKHFDSAMVMEGKIYLAHSNYPEWPMTARWRSSTPRRLSMLARIASASSGDRSPGWTGTTATGG
jgi:hypothetical protein